MHIPWFREKVIRFNKQTLNPSTLKIAGRRSSVYATLKHVGWRSGREYTTPVVAKPLGAGLSPSQQFLGKGLTSLAVVLVNIVFNVFVFKGKR